MVRSLSIILLFLLGFASMVSSQGRYQCERYRKKADQALEGTRQLKASLRSDSLDILHYSINLDILPEKKQLNGFCEVTGVVEPGVKGVVLDLLQLKVEQVILDEKEVSWNYNDTLLSVPFPPSKKKRDTFSLKVHYKGEPQVDPTGWGGFYFNGERAFNLGIGFGGDPHNYGRTWFPCVDNFIDKATYDFQIRVPEGLSAYCNGMLQKEHTEKDFTTYHWELGRPIPTYLASVGVGPYANVKMSYESISGETIPVWIVCLPEDTTKARRSFDHVDEAMRAFENAFGPYKWHRVGYLLVPFSAGAMEHASNIAFPDASATGSTDSDPLMAHELSHHWWGNLVTCASASDMWINEGMASYSELLFAEAMRGENGYRKAVAENHKNVLLNAHRRDGGKYRAVYGPPHKYTYGAHVYDKGADVVHTLRTYLGDSLFFKGMKQLLRDHPYGNLSTCQFRDELNKINGVDVTEFFDQWIFNPGFPHFSVVEWNVAQQGEKHVLQVDIQQQLTKATDYFTGLPLEITAMSKDGQVFTKTFRMYGSYNSINFEVPFAPAYVGLNLGGRISDATIKDTLTVKEALKDEELLSGGELSIESIEEEAFFAVTHHVTTPSPLKKKRDEYRISREHYWTLDGVWEEGDLKGELKIPAFDKGREIGLDISNEKDLQLFYRSSPSENWELCDYSKWEAGEKEDDGKGCFLLDSLQKGDYVVGQKGAK